MSHKHSHSQGEHPHSHGGVDAGLAENREATKVLLISLAGLLLTAVIQALVVALSGSVALLADTIHNFGDALTSIPLWFAFWLNRRIPTKRFSYGLNRSEDLAGLFIVAVISISALVAAYESIVRILHRTEPNHLWAVVVAAFVGFLGNEVAAIVRIRMGSKLGSAALIADGKHARIDGITSLAVLLGVIGVWLGYPIVDPIVGFMITVMILFVAKDSVKAVFTRLLDGIEPDTMDQIKTTTLSVEGVCQVTDVRARWFGHHIRAELSIAVDSQLSVRTGHDLAKAVIHRLRHDIAHLEHVEIHVDPLEEQGSVYHAHQSEASYQSNAAERSFPGG